MIHTPVLKKEVLEVLDPKPNENFIDGTIGFGGHAKEILEAVKPEGKVLGIEWDKEAHDSLRAENIERLLLVNDSYTNLKKIVRETDFGPVNGILFDLGMSSWDVDKSGRGFSFLKDEPLDMRFSQNMDFTARDLVNSWKEEDIAAVLKEYGEERFARRIAKRIIEERKRSSIETTFQLTEIVKRAFPASYKFGKKHVAARTFQALRIAVNDELNNIKKGLEQAAEVLGEGGRIGVISFHSLEDRIVKNFFRDNNDLIVLTKKPLTASEEEIRINYRSHSAKFRGAVKK